MTYDELPPEYQKLCFERTLEFLKDQEAAWNLIEKYEGSVAELFNWSDAKEGSSFWLKIYESKHVEDLPPFPYNITKELYPIY